MNETETTKLCTGCFYRQPFENFYKRKDVSDGHMNRCKTCCRIFSNMSYRKKKSKVGKVNNTNNYTWMNGDDCIYL
jgi:hypothetical protein